MTRVDWKAVSADVPVLIGEAVEKFCEAGFVKEAKGMFSSLAPVLVILITNYAGQSWSSSTIHDQAASRIARVMNKPYDEDAYQEARKEFVAVITMKYGTTEMVYRKGTQVRVQKSLHKALIAWMFFGLGVGADVITTKAQRLIRDSLGVKDFGGNYAMECLRDWGDINAAAAKYNLTVDQVMVIAWANKYILMNGRAAFRSEQETADRKALIDGMTALRAKVAEVADRSSKLGLILVEAGKHIAKPQ